MAATQWSASAGSTAIWKKAWPASDGVLGSDTHVVPPSSERIAPIPRYDGRAFTMRAANSASVSPSPVPTYTRLGLAGLMAMAPQARLVAAKLVGF